MLCKKLLFLATSAITSLFNLARLINSKMDIIVKLALIKFDLRWNGSEYLFFFINMLLTRNSRERPAFSADQSK